MLSPLEKSCLRWLAHGRDIEVIARLEARTVAEIEQCLASALAALGVETIEDALRKTGILGLTDDPQSS
ncbi:MULTISPECIES: LuxR family transcriptional regulator [Rhizobium]|uniref:LuxR family transcriptional regulator n=1 Tax=Rhizobium binae TaxID=1138190 RepID=A0ABV2MKW7_9HYPH|nr:MULTISPECIES: LuxR family transcriptional regulator [Rhizobium]NKL49594.1 LuxR family transcriptional regulator [Rhizobium leguminosarum bv. viciae]MBX4937064.1 LuxR family transcriptional regulator [Rhizobium binae]MBX4943714.1 LuxR family transcriptional regulator [Rhizobium binae]MBX4979158.1 LuxR family transcriptional regulator [Rhizobium binae]MBX4995895.1 LuxR family transcriptional regulator [Rhizobium binae]